ncbi:MAG: ATP-binding protein [Planctomycetota bacterium]
MDSRSVKLSGDNIRRQYHCGARAAIEELIWNGLDSGSDLVEVLFDENALGDVQSIEVRDRGAGLPFSELDRAFGTLGESRKVALGRTSNGRILHGSEGRGRYKALALGARARWRTVYRDGDRFLTYDIHLSRNGEEKYHYTNPVATDDTETGTTVRIDDIDEGRLSIATDDSRNYIGQRLAIYLLSYKTVKIRYGTEWLDPASQIARITDEILLAPIAPDKPAPRVRIVEWKLDPGPRKILLCDDSGFVREEVLARIHGHDLNIFAFVSYSEVPKWVAANLIALAEMGGEDSSVKRLIEATKREMKSYVLKRLEENSKSLVEKWKTEKSYPYKETEPETPVLEAERTVFNIVAARINDHHDAFRSGKPVDRRLTLTLLRQAIESDPSNLRLIFEEVIALPEEQRKDLADLLKRTNLTAIIGAAKTVADRLTIIEGFDHILFDTDWRAKLRERTQLHRLLVHHQWIFGDEYTTDTDDDGLRAVLTKHLAHLGRTDPSPEVDVTLIDGKDGIPDLMLSRQFRRDRGMMEHLVVELKRPSVAIGATEIVQIKKYAQAVVADERFSKTTTRWTFLLLGNDWDGYAESEAAIEGLPYGTIDQKPGVRIIMKRWSDVLAEARQRYEFFRAQLDVEARKSEGFEYLRTHHAELLAGKGLTKKRERQLLESTIVVPPAQPPAASPPGP